MILLRKSNPQSPNLQTAAVLDVGGVESKAEYIMIEIGSIGFLIKVPSLPEKDFELYSSKLFDQWESNVENSLILPDYSISLEVEEGSISGKAKIAAAVGAIYMGVANYGGFISGLQTIRSQISYVNNLLVDSAKQPFTCSKKDLTVRNRGGALTKLQFLFHKVQKGELTADEATLYAIELFGAEAENVPGFIAQLKNEFESARKHPEQLNLIDYENEECESLLKNPPKKPSKIRSPKPAPASQQFRIEIWRESKKAKKHMKLTKK